MSEDKTRTVRIRQSTWGRLAEIGRFGETTDDVVTHLLDLKRELAVRNATRK